MTVIQRSGTCKKSWPFILYILTNKIKGQKCPISSYFNSLKFCWEHARSERPSELQLFNNYPLVDESVFVSHVFVLLITERYCTLDSYLSIINKINTHETNTDSSTTTWLKVQCLNFQVCLKIQLQKWVGQRHQNSGPFPSLVIFVGTVLMVE